MIRCASGTGDRLLRQEDDASVCAHSYALRPLKNGRQKHRARHSQEEAQRPQAHSQKFFPYLDVALRDVEPGEVPHPGGSELGEL